MLLYCAVRDISVGDFFRAVVSGNTPPPGPAAGSVTGSAPPGPTGATGTPVSPSGGPAGPTGPSGSSGGSNALVTIPGTNQKAQSRWINQIGAITRMFGVTVSSGYRTAQHNAEVGGAPNSDHLTGNAVDFVGSQSALQKLQAWAGRFWYVEPWSQTGGTHVHISFNRKPGG